jgi:hypothetical protein
MTTFYDLIGSAGPAPNLLGSALVRLKPMIGSELADWGFSWTLKASDGDDLEAEIDGHTYEYLIIDPGSQSIVDTYTVANGGIIVSSSAGAFVIGAGETLDAGIYVHCLRATNTSTGHTILFFEGSFTILKGAS